VLRAHYDGQNRHFDRYRRQIAPLQGKLAALT
jgi:hypothetical protein